MDSDVDVGRRLIAFRESRGMNQVQFALELNIAKNTLNGYETGERPLPAEKAKRIRERFGVSLDWLLYGDIGQPGYEIAVKLGPKPSIKADAKAAAAQKMPAIRRKAANK
jgi:transcriptional regulator with XRE-family HTH domain